MKKTFMLLLSIVFLISGCCEKNTYEGDPLAVKIISGEKEYTPVIKFVYENDNGRLLDSNRLDPSKVWVQLPSIPIKEDFEIIYTEEPMDSPSFILYDSENSPTRLGNTLKMPEAPGKYLLCIELALGTENYHSGYQYFFELRVD